ncbi:hypothetical protein BU24DRAFT_88615 [Aaosphaeria arxii CBS 175.79]|uniref:Uncharacterized protein n=1 Tax=Aaosphaeria arxii CBS 175.79 TaxID=1450172 RepID=A0A6A5X7L5_9PLEO|nr:uncharacterized protein BU24DRAFT_88615 [Aaosphaeria arxii CBS 175.79]KAF2008933.1 hypothetical protein BU24DRAFT_88615 [Aaosphaeria arxii CBS 175.79]
MTIHLTLSHTKIVSTPLHSFNTPAKATPSVQEPFALPGLLLVRPASFRPASFSNHHHYHHQDSFLFLLPSRPHLSLLAVPSKLEIPAGPTIISLVPRRRGVRPNSPLTFSLFVFSLFFSSHLSLPFFSHYTLARTHPFRRHMP